MAHNCQLWGAYDSHGTGNVVADNLGNSYTYDAEGRPVNGTQVVYDVFNRAVEFNNGSSHTQVVYDSQGGKLAYMSGQTLQKYMLPLAGGVQAVFNSSGLWYYRHADWLGSSRLALDTNGNLYAGRAYAPFGETYAETGAADRSFTGQTQDVIAGSTGIYDFLFRQHSAAQGRWLVPDPAGLAAADLTNPQTWNRYAYVMNNPLSRIDPLGLCDEPDQWDSSTNTVTGSQPCQSWWTFVIQGLPQYAYCAFTGSCSPYPPGGGGGGGQPQPGPQPKPKPQPTVNKVINSVKNAVTAAVCFGANATGLTSLPGMTNSTVGFGLGGSVGVGVYAGVSVNAGAQVVADQQGNVGLAITFGGNPYLHGVWAFGAMGGAQAMKSNVSTIYDLKGFSASAGVGLGTGSAAGSFDFSTNGDSWAGTFTVGVGAGPVSHSVVGNVSKTWVPLSVNCQ
ncbi:MAG: RHS repeat-associated core domain-containing protein [Candidatus Korobacteraceae bacterium]